MQSPRKATVQDFLSDPDAASAMPTNSSASALKPGAGTAQAQPARIAAAAGRSVRGELEGSSASEPLGSGAPVSVVVRKMPMVQPVARIVPDPVTEPVLYTSRGHLIVPPAMKGSREILLRQNEMADMDGLIRVQDDADLERLRGERQLVALPAGNGLEVDERLPTNRRYCRPWTAQFLTTLARAHYARFHTPLQVNSAVRTVEFQERLRYSNGNAAPAGGETASPHLTGQAVDLAKHGLSMTEIAWLRGYLMPLVQQGKLDVEEEFQQACFHISVYRKYLPEAAPRREIQERHGAASALAAAMQ